MTNNYEENNDNNNIEPDTSKNNNEEQKENNKEKKGNTLYSTLRRLFNINISLNLLTLLVLLAAIAFGYKIVFHQDEEGKVTITFGKETYISKPERDASKNKSFYISAEVVGSGIALYPNQDKPIGSSLMTPLIYTNRTERLFRTLKNIDQLDKRKRNSQSLQAKLMERNYERLPVCLEIYGFRDYDSSEFLNIIKAKVLPEDQYNPEDIPASDSICEKILDQD